MARSGSTTAYNTTIDGIKTYVAIAPYTSVPYMDGAGAAGGSALYSRGDHVHPSDTSKLSLSGGVMSGPLTLAADGTAALHATTKQQLDAATTGAGYAPIASPVFTGNPQAPTSAVGDNDSSIATTQFVQSAIAAAGVGQTFYYDLTDTTDVAGYKRLLLTPSTHTENSVAVACSGTSDVAIASFVTDPGVPGAVNYPAGTAYRRLYASVSAGSAKLHLQVYVRTAAGVETLVRDEFSQTFSDTTPALQEWLATPAAAGTMAVTDRIVNKVFAQRVSGSGTITVTFYAEGSAHASQIQTTIPPSASAPLSATPPLALSGGVLSLDMTALPHPNVLHNFGFAVNQRSYTSGTALAAAAYGFDRWKAGASGCTLTFTASPPTTVVTITAGSLQQIVEGTGVRGGNHTLSWTGTAQGRIGAGSYAASPVTASLTAGANTTVEFNTGTLSNPKLEEGSVATPLARRDPADELALCQRFYQYLGPFVLISNGAGSYGGGAASTTFPVAMRATPTVALPGLGGSATGGLSYGATNTVVSVNFASAMTLGAYYTYYITATADL